jgi:hypothetical protein
MLITLPPIDKPGQITTKYGTQQTAPMGSGNCDQGKVQMAKKGEMVRGKEKPAETAANVPAVIDTNTPGEGELLVIGGRKFAVKRVVTLPLLKHLDGQVVMVQINSPIYTGNQVPAEKGSANATAKPADLCDVLELNTGRKMQYIVAAVAKSNFETKYPNQSYVGKYFAIRKGEKREGKRYRDYEIIEIAAEVEAAA